MRPSRRTFLTGAGAVTALATVGNVSGLTRALAASKTDITFWCTPFIDGEDPKDFLSWFRQQESKDLTTVAFSTDYGPGAYNTQKQKFIIQAKTGTPDILEGLLEDMVTYIRAGIISPLTSEFHAWADHTKFLAPTVKGLMYNGQLYGVPYNTNARGMLYRKSILKKHGLKVPTTWDELLNTAAAISAKEPGMSGFMLCTNRASVRGPQEWISWFFQLNPHVFKQNPSTKKWSVVATPAQFARVFQLYHDLFFAHKPAAANTQYLGIDYDVLDNGYVTGKWAMVPEGPWMWGDQNSGKQQKYIITEDTGIAPLPVAPGGGHGTYLEIKPIFLNKFSKNPAAGWKGIQYLTSYKILGQWSYVSGFIPPRVDIQNSPRFKADWWQRGFGELLPTGVGLDPVNYTPVFDAIFATLQTVVYKQATPAQAGAALHTKLNQLLAQNML